MTPGDWVYVVQGDGQSKGNPVGVHRLLAHDASRWDGLYYLVEWDHGWTVTEQNLIAHDLAWGPGAEAGDLRGRRAWWCRLVRPATAEEVAQDQLDTSRVGGL